MPLSFQAGGPGAGSRLLHLVAQAPHHLDVPGVGRVDLQLLPQMPDVDGHRVLRAQGGVVPHPLIDLAGGEDPPRMAHEQQEDVVFDGGQADPLPVHRHRFGPVIHGDAPVAEDLRGVRRLLLPPQGGVPPELALDPRQHLNGVEGLGHIVVRPDVQPQDLVGVLALGGEKDDGDVLRLPQLGGGPNPVQPRHHDVHEDEVDLVLLYHVQGLDAVIGVIRLIAVAGEIDVQGRDDVPVVVTDQNIVQKGSLLRFHGQDSTALLRSGGQVF